MRNIDALAVISACLVVMGLLEIAVAIISVLDLLGVI